MKHFTLILFFLPLFIISQNNVKGHFEITKDAYYFKKIEAWKGNIYSQKWQGNFGINRDNASIFSFWARNFKFKETIQLSLNKEKKITKIEIFFTVHDGEFDEWFPLSYPIKINDLFENVGNPKVTHNVEFKSVYNDEISDVNFNDYYKWDSALFMDTKTEIEVASGTANIAIKNKRGKIKKYEKIKIGYISYTPITSGIVSEKDKNFNTSLQVSKGAKKKWLNDRNELMQFLGIEDFLSSDEFVKGDMYPYLFFNDNENDPDEFYKRFYFMAFNIYGLEVGDTIFKENRKYTYTSLPSDILAQAVGMDKECCVEILINSEYWNKSTYLDKLFILFHELGHDVFGLEHSDGIRLMATNKLNIENPETLGEMIHEMFVAVLKNQKN